MPGSALFTSTAFKSICVVFPKVSMRDVTLLEDIAATFFSRDVQLFNPLLEGVI